MVKYLVELATTDRITGEIKFYEELQLDSMAEANDKLMTMLGDLTDREYPHFKKITPVIKCDCGKEVYCTSFTNTCECGADYNFNGDRLAPREQWGEETGEHWTDCY